MMVLVYTFKTTSANGMCSFGPGNVGSYNRTFIEEDIAYQAFNNPAGQFNYSQLLDEAKKQTYIITGLFNNSDISPSMFNIFLPDETIPTTDFLTAPAPDGPITTGMNPPNIIVIINYILYNYSLSIKYRLNVTSHEHNVYHTWLL